MPQSLADCGLALDGAVQFVRLGVQPRTVYPRQAFRRQHLCDLGERESAGASERDQGQPLQHGGIEEAAQAASADRAMRSFSS